MLKKNRFKNQPTEQGQLLPTYTSDRISEDNPARILSAIIDTLDLSFLYQLIGGGKNY